MMDKFGDFLITRPMCNDSPQPIESEGEQELSGGGFRGGLRQIPGSYCAINDLPEAIDIDRSQREKRSELLGLLHHL